MAIWDNWINRRVERIVLSRINGLTMQRMRLPSTDAVYPDSSTHSYLRNGYTGNAAVYSIVSLAARKFGVIPRYVYKVKDKRAEKMYKTLYTEGLHNVGALQRSLIVRRKAYEETIAVDGKLSELIARPNPMEGQDQFFEKVYIFYQLGEAFVWLNRGDIDGMDDGKADKMPVLEMHVLPPAFVELIPDPDDVFGILGYYFLANGAERIFVRKTDMIHWKKTNPHFDAGSREHLRGLSPLRAGWKVLTQDDEITDASVAMSQNGGAKGVLSNKDKAKLTPQQESDLRSVIDRKVNNNKMKAAVAALQGEWAYHDLGATSVDMQLVDWSKVTMEKLCNIFGVPPELFISGNTYENKNQARKDLITNNIIPACNSFRDELNRQLLPAFGLTNETIDNDYSELPELQQDIKMMVDTLERAWWYTPNQRRAMMNDEPDPNPNMDKYYIPNNLQDIDDVGMEELDFQDNENDEL